MLFEVWNVDEPHADRDAAIVAGVLARDLSFREAVARVRASTDLPARAAAEAAAYVTKGRGRSAVARLLELAAVIEPAPSHWLRHYATEWTGTQHQLAAKGRREKAELFWFTRSIVEAVGEEAASADGVRRLRRQRADRATNIEHGARMLALRGACRCVFATAMLSGRGYRYCDAEVTGRMLVCAAHASAHHDAPTRRGYERAIRRAHEALAHALLAPL